MGGLVRLDARGVDQVFGTADDKINTYFLTDDSIKIYQGYPNYKITILTVIPDSTIHIFQLVDASPIAADDVATYQQLINSFEALGYTQGDSVNYANQLQGASIKAVMDYQNQLNANTATQTNAVDNAQLSYEQSLLNPMFQTKYDTSVTQSFTEPTTTKPLYDDTFASILSGAATGKPGLPTVSIPNPTGIDLTNAFPADSSHVTINPSDAAPFAYKMQTVLGSLLFEDNTLHIPISIKTLQDIPVQNANLRVQISDLASNVVILQDIIAVETKNQDIQKDYTIAQGTSQRVKVDLFLLTIDNQALAAKTSNSVSWQPGTIGKTNPTPVIITPLVNAFGKYKNFVIISGIVTTVLIGYAVIKKQKKTKKESDK